MAWNELGCYGGRNVPTPNIDRLAKEGMRFTQACASMSMCVPLRASLYTGLYPMHHGVTRNHAQTRVGTKSVVHWLSALGYRVGLTGKEHCTPASVYPFEKVEGFEKNCVARTADYRVDGVRRFITSKASQPFCLFVASTLPHIPWTVGDPSPFPPQRLVLPPNWIDTPQTRSQFSKYCAEVAVLDRQVGDVLGVVDEAGLADSTLVMFSSEQGPQFPGGKWTLYDHGVKTAIIARWPGHVRPASTSDALVQYEDVVPTLIEAAGGTPPAGLDGRSFLGALLGKDHGPRECVFGVHNNVPEGTPYPIRSIRTRQYKLILNLAPERSYFEKHLMPDEPWQSWLAAARAGPPAARLVERYVKRPAIELYDVAADPWELDNLAGRPEHAATVRQLESRLRRWMTEQGDPGESLDREPPSAR